MSKRAVLPALLTAAAVVWVFRLGPIPQDPAYHRFADARPLAGVPNAGDVLSNLPFLAAGLYGLSRAKRLREPRTRRGYVALCAGVALVSLGSAYYHWSPADATLLWDRLPMTVSFMALFSLLLEERVGASGTLVPLIVAGLASAFYWSAAGDLRPYLLVQFLPLALMPLILGLYPREYLDGAWLIGGMSLYAAAKACEAWDRAVLDALVLMSGHSLKHLLAAAASACVIRAVPARRSLAPEA